MPWTMGLLGATGTAVKTLSFVSNTSTQNTGGTVTVPSVGVQAGDLAILYTIAAITSGSLASVSPGGGWSVLHDYTLTGDDSRTWRLTHSAKVLTAGDLGSTVNVVAGDQAQRQAFFIFRAEVALRFFEVLGAQASASATGSPSTAVNVTGQLGVGVVFSTYGSFTSPNPNLTGITATEIQLSALRVIRYGITTTGFGSYTSITSTGNDQYAFNDLAVLRVN